jgi:hypothetical protein
MQKVWHGLTDGVRWICSRKRQNLAPGFGGVDAKLDHMTQRPELLRIINNADTADTADSAVILAVADDGTYLVCRDIDTNEWFIAPADELRHGDWYAACEHGGGSNTNACQLCD